MAFLEAKGMPFLVAINDFDGAPRYPTEEVRKALSLPATVPVITIDARQRDSAKQALIAIAEYALAQCDQPIPDGPLAGVPVLMKDLGQEIAGVAQTDGCRALQGNVAAFDSELVARYRRYVRDTPPRPT